VLAHPGWWIRQEHVGFRGAGCSTTRSAAAGIGQARSTRSSCGTRSTGERSRELIDELGRPCSSAGSTCPSSCNSDFHRAYSHRHRRARATRCSAPRAPTARSRRARASVCARRCVRGASTSPTGRASTSRSRGRVPGEIVDGDRRDPPRGAGARARARGAARSSSSWGREVRVRVPLPAGTTVEQAFTIAVPPADSFVRVENPARERARGNRAAVLAPHEPDYRIDVLPAPHRRLARPGRRPDPRPAGAFVRRTRPRRERARAQRAAWICARREPEDG
jgi:hypothetical protein